MHTEGTFFVLPFYRLAPLFVCSKANKTLLTLEGIKNNGSRDVARIEMRKKGRKKYE